MKLDITQDELDYLIGGVHAVRTIARRQETMAWKARTSGDDEDAHDNLQWACDATNHRDEVEALYNRLVEYDDAD
jgi:hypothetical protein